MTVCYWIGGWEPIVVAIVGSQREIKTWTGDLDKDGDKGLFQETFFEVE